MHSPRILCVDDNQINLRLLDAVLRPQGYEVVTASNGLEALNIIVENNFDLVLLDVMMPEFDGFEVCRWIKQEESYRDIPVVMITALQSREDRVQGIEAGADDFLSKPFDKAEVLARVKMLLRVRELNESRMVAYQNLDHLSSLGERLIRGFDPLQFDFLGQIDQMVLGLISPAASAVHHPQLVVIGTNRENQDWRWYRYANNGQPSVREPLSAGAGCGLTQGPTGYGGLFYYNEAELQSPECQRLVASLPIAGEPVTNLLGYLSEGFCLYALNYGKEITPYETAVVKNLVMQGLFLQSISTQLREVEEAFVYTVQALARAAEANDEDTGNHIVRIGDYCAVLAETLGQPEDFVRTIRIQAQMHDVGKIHTPNDVLRKPDALSAEEWEIVKLHTVLGGKILGDHPRLQMAHTIALQHHERWDGSGYPRGLQGEDISLEARITFLADQYDALRQTRPYKSSFDHDKTCQILLVGDGRTQTQHFDPQILQAFGDNTKKFEEIFEASL